MLLDDRGPLVRAGVVVVEFRIEARVGGLMTGERVGEGVRGSDVDGVFPSRSESSPVMSISSVSVGGGVVCV